MLLLFFLNLQVYLPFGMPRKKVNGSREEFPFRKVRIWSWPSNPFHIEGRLYMVKSCNNYVDYSALTAEELFLKCGQDGSQAAWREFMRRYHRLISLTVIRVLGSRGSLFKSSVEDLIQEVYLKLCKNQCAALSQFRSNHEGAELGYLKIVATNVVRDYMRSHSFQEDSDCEWIEKSKGNDRALGGEGFVQQSILVDQVSSLLERFLPETTRERDRTIFWSYYRDGLTAAAIAGLGLRPALSVEGVESVILRLSRMIRNALQDKKGKGHSAR